MQSVHDIPSNRNVPHLHLNPHPDPLTLEELREANHRLRAENEILEEVDATLRLLAAKLEQLRRAT